MNKAIIVGAGLSGAVIARHLAEHGIQVSIYDRRNHIAGNMYDYRDEHGFLVQKYGPHTFHTKIKRLYEYMCQYELWQAYKLTCGAVWDGKYTPTPFNFSTIDTFYPKEKAEMLKNQLKEAFDGKDTATVVEVLENEDPLIREYAEFLFQNDYAPYTAKQWGVSPEEIDPSVLKRVPLRFSYAEGYFDDPYQVMPVHSFTHFFENLLQHPNIDVTLNMDALQFLDINKQGISWKGNPFTGLVIYTGPIDALFHFIYGALPYRSLRFEWKYTQKNSVQEAPVVAIPRKKALPELQNTRNFPCRRYREVAMQ